jgi:phosphoglycerate dehydrogenase-like enzyme
MTKKILFLGPSEVFNQIESFFCKYDEFYLIHSEVSKIADDIVDAYGIIDASMKVKFDETLISKSKHLKAISCATTGSDHISLEALNSRQIELFTLREDKELLLNLTPAAELTWTLLLACARNIKGAINHVSKGLWFREDFPGIMLNGKTMGIIGCGRIGSWISKYASAFGMNVIGYDPYLEDFPNHIKNVDLVTLFTGSDFISIHVHLSTETEGLVNERLLSICKSNVIIINTSRGKIIDEEALLYALENKKVGAVGLDVLDGEPNIIGNKLFQYSLKNDNLIISPHCGGYSLEAVEKVCIRASEKIVNKLLSGKY